jgi:hypothetical protein
LRSFRFVLVSSVSSVVKDRLDVEFYKSRSAAAFVLRGFDY